MIPILTAVAAAGSIIQGIAAMRNAAQPQAPVAEDFAKQLDAQVQTKPASPSQKAQVIHQMLALQRSLGTLNPAQQIELAQMILNQQVQLSDRGGNSITGLVSAYQVVNGQIEITVNGRSHPLSSVQAVLQGVNPS
jgi:hypothetical protein